MGRATSTFGHLKLLSPARGRGWVRGLRTSIPPHLASPPSGGEEYELEMYELEKAITP
jgi:hypothetical protein